MPKKLYVTASRFADAFADAGGFGWRVGETTFDWPSLVAAKEKEITRLSAAYRANLKASGAELIEERATIVAPQRVRLAGGRELSARHVLIACGSRPSKSVHSVPPNTGAPSRSAASLSRALFMSSTRAGQSRRAVPPRATNT